VKRAVRQHGATVRLHRLAQALPKPLWVLLALYVVASLAHFVHNAEYIPFYPNMPAWITRETVYAAWLGQALVGATGVVLATLRWRVASSILLAVFGAFGLDGLLHYTLALCSEHTLLANLTIWSEASLGLLLLLSCAVLCVRSLGIGATPRNRSVA